MKNNMRKRLLFLRVKLWKKIIEFAEKRKEYLFDKYFMYR